MRLIVLSLLVLISTADVLAVCIVTSARRASSAALFAGFAGFSGAAGGGARVGGGGLPLLLLRFDGLLSKFSSLIRRGAERNWFVARRVGCLGSAQWEPPGLARPALRPWRHHGTELFRNAFRSIWV